MSPRILHVLTSPDFVDVVARSFESAAPGANKYLCVGFEPEEIRTQLALESARIDEGAATARELSRHVEDSDIAVFHSVNLLVASALTSAPQRVLRVWSGWGWDYYGTARDRLGGQLAPLTKALTRRRQPLTSIPRSAVNDILVARELARAARSSDVFSAPIPQDEAVFRRRFGGFSGHYQQLNYATVEDTLASGPDAVTGDSLLVGNSASPTNNHLDAFEAIAAQDIGSSRVVVPLAYGDRDYAGHVIARGTSLFGSRFVPLRDFMPLDEYHELMSACSVIVLPHWRQQGMGNVLRALWQGAHVVLDRKNPVAAYLQSIGAEYHVLDRCGLGDLARSPVDATKREAHRRILREYWSRDAAANNVRALLDLASAKCE